MPNILENISLVLLRDSDAPEMWIDRWAYSYPSVHQTHLSSTQTIIQWQNQIQQLIEQIATEDHIMLVAHGAAANATAAWYYASNTNIQQRILGIILASPEPTLCQYDKTDTFERVRFNCRTALVIGQQDVKVPPDWAEQQAQKWQARFFITPYQGHLDSPLDGWQWGMKLMQEMLLA